MTPTHALTTAGLLLILAWCASVLLPAAWHAHQRGLARVRTAEARELLGWRDRDQEALERLVTWSAPAVLLPRRVPAGDLYPHARDTRCSHGRTVLERCDDCRLLRR